MEETEGRRGLGSSVHEQQQEALGKGCVRNTVEWTVLPCWSSGQDSELPMQGAWVQPLVRKIDP